ncbi:MAG: murein hydrolase activator EnvC family protein [Oscillospiraceae bacterium]|nr:peptidoglycan DD-metalloendopeptidase family protein [Bacillota bacterium]
MKRKKLVSAVAAGMAILLILALLLSLIPATVFAASSSDIQEELNNLESQAQEIQRAKEELAQQQAANASDTRDVVSRKKDIDQEIKIIHDEIENLNAQIQNYNQLIVEKQKELDDAQTRQAELNQQYRVRIRTMEESGKISYWSVLFQANSFTDLLDTINKISEIAAHDQAMLAELDRVAQEIQTAQAELAQEKSNLDAQKTALAVSQAELDEKSAEANAILAELTADAAKLDSLYVSYEDKEAALTDEIAQKEQEYTAALAQEEEARRQEEERRRQEEENRRQEEENRRQEEENNGGSEEEGGGESGGSSGSSSSSSGWLYPLPYRVAVTSAYGYRVHPVTGAWSFHTGVDLGAAEGTPIYATRSGTVTTATYSDVYGNYVTINHGDGYSSLYGHMTHYVVSAGEYVSQGEVIGYVGSTGWSTGPHLHFTIYYNGSTVNPMDYI